MTSMGDMPVTGDWESHTSRGSNGWDIGTFSGTNVFVRNGACVVHSGPSGDGNGNLTIIQLPDGRRFSFLHGTRSLNNYANYDAIPLEGQDYLTPEEKEKLAAQKAERDQKIFDEANSGPNAAAQSTSTPPVEASDSTEPAKSKPAEPRFDPASFVGGTSTGIDPFGEEDTIDAETAKEKSIQGLEGVAAIPMGAIDFGLDVVGTVPGLGGVDDWWDETTKFSSPVTQNVRSLASVIVPTMYLGPLGGGAATAGVMRVGLGGSKIAKGLASVTGYAMTDAAVTGFSDYSERDEGLMKGLDEFLDSIGNPLGMNIPDAMKVMDGDDPTVRRQKLMFETAGLSIVGDVLGYALSGGKPIMNWFKPKDDVAKQYKAAQSRVNPDEFTVKATAELDKGIYEAEQLGQTDVALSLTRDRDRAIEEYLDSGMSEYTLDPLESYVDASRPLVSGRWMWWVKPAFPMSLKTSLTPSLTHECLMKPLRLHSVFLTAV